MRRRGSGCSWGEGRLAYVKNEGDCWQGNCLDICYQLHTMDLYCTLQGGYMLNVITKPITEAQQVILQSIDESVAKFEATGLHVTLDEVKAWSKAIEIDPNAKLPECHL